MNAYEDTARERKATAIVSVLEAQHATAKQVAALDTDGRRAAEKLAVVKPASAATWARVVEVLQQREDHARFLRAGQVPLDATDDDPFDLLPERRSA